MPCWKCRLGSSASTSISSQPFTALYRWSFNFLRKFPGSSGIVWREKILARMRSFSITLGHRTIITSMSYPCLISLQIALGGNPVMPPQNVSWIHAGSWFSKTTPNICKTSILYYPFRVILLCMAFGYKTGKKERSFESEMVVGWTTSSVSWLVLAS